MPRNRPDRTRDDKAAEIVTIAQRLFLEQGYNGTTIAAIAKDAGIATNVVHWYFATKDDLFVAVLEALQSKDLEAAGKRLARSTGGEPEEMLEAFLTDFVCRRLERYELIATLHERSHCSSVIAEYHEAVHRRYADHLGRAVDACPIPAADQGLVVEALITAVEGLVMHRASKREARRMMTFLMQRLITDRKEPLEIRQETKR